MLSPGLVWFPTHEELGGGGRWSGPFTYKAVDNRQTQRGHGCLATADPTQGRCHRGMASAHCAVCRAIHSFIGNGPTITRCGSQRAGTGTQVRRIHPQAVTVAPLSCYQPATPPPPSVVWKGRNPP